MLVLGRKPDESILIGTDIRITIVRVKEGRVKVGIEAPEEIPVVREELLSEEELEEYAFA